MPNATIEVRRRYLTRAEETGRPVCVGRRERTKLPHGRQRLQHHEGAIPAHADLLPHLRAIFEAVHAAMMEGLKIPEPPGTRPFDSSSTSRTAFHTIASDTPSSTSTCSPAGRSGPRRPCTRQSSGTWSRSAFPPIRSRFCCAMRVQRRTGASGAAFRPPKSTWDSRSTCRTTPGTAHVTPDRFVRG